MDQGWKALLPPVAAWWLAGCGGKRRNVRTDFIPRAMRTVRVPVALLLCLALAAEAGAYEVGDEEPPYGASQSDVNEALRDCDKDERTIAICAWSSYRRASKTLRRVVKETEAALESGKTRLAYFRTSQKAWERFRNADCEYDHRS